MCGLLIIKEDFYNLGSYLSDKPGFLRIVFLMIW